MKRSLFLSLLLALSIITSAQYQVTNSSFETSESDALHGVGNRPTGWQASNVSQFGFSMLMYTLEGNGHTGNCAKLANASLVGNTSPAWLSLGNPWSYIASITQTAAATAGTDGGITWTHRPDSMEVWIKRNNNSGENAFLVYYAWTGTSRGDSYKGQNGNCTSTQHYDEESDIRQGYDANDCGTAVQATQIAEGCWHSTQTYNSWTKIVVPITYLSNAVPAKMNIILSAGNYPNKRATGSHDGSALWVDDLRLIYSSKAHEILLNNRQMSGFDQNTYTYTYTLGASATSVPTIVPKRSGRELASSEYTVNYAPLGDTTTVTITAEDGSSTTTYKILFTTQLSNNSRLADIQVGGESVTGFNPLIFNYSIELPYGTTTYPAITYTFGESGQTAVVNTPSSFPGTATVVCTAPDGTTTSTYNLTFTVGALTDNTLTDIKVNGKTITGFRPTRNTYVVELPTGTTADPVVTYTTAYPNDHIIVLTDNGLSGGATITVTPRGTTNTRTYRLTYLITASTYSYLQDIKLDGVSIPEFVPETLTYYDTLPIGTTSIPAVTWVAGDEYQTISYQAGSIDGTSRITVTSQSGATSIYRINFTTLKSSNADLADILLDGVSMTGFNPATTSYTVNLPVGVTTAPAITWTTGDQYQTVTLMDGGLSSPSRLVVRAGDGTTKTYTITFTSSQSSNSLLSSLLLDGTQITGWNPATTEYSVSLPRGTTMLPNITWVAGDQYQTIRKSEGGVNGDTRITVKAQNGSSTIYVIHFSVLTNDCNHLTNIFVGGNAIPDFHQDTLSYNYTLPGGTTTLPEITYTKGDPSQNVALTRGGINGITTLVVRAESGSTRTYTITFSVTRSANALLQDIQIDSVSIPGFRPDSLNYDYVVSSTATSCPRVSVTKNDGQNVTITVPSIVGTVRITVTPETGASNIYTINMHYVQSSVKTLSDIHINGSSIYVFNPATRHYTGTLNADGSMPTVEGIPGDPMQTVHVNSDLANHTSYIYVQAENGDTAIYSVSFSRAVSTISTLSDLKIDGTTIANFSSSTLNYNYTLTTGTTVSPAITYTLTDSKARAVTTTPALDGAATIEVIAEDGISKTTYTVNLNFVKSSDATLSAVTRNGVNIPLTDFVNDTAHLALAYGEAIPTIGYVKGNSRQMVMLANAGAQGTDIVVYAEDSTSRLYSVRYNIARSSNSQLADLNIDGFTPSTTTYNVTLPWRTRILPVLEPKNAIEGQTINVTYGRIQGTDGACSVSPSTILVTAPDGVSTTSYTINYSVKQSTVNYLEAIYYNNVQLPYFDRDRLNYTITLPENTTTTPKLTWDLAVAPDGSDIVEQRVAYHEGTLNDTSYIIVTAENGATRRYNITYKVAESEEPNRLALIALGGETLTGFDPDVFNYTISLPSGTTTLPALTYVKKFQSQSVEIISDGTDGVTTLLVRSNRADNDSVIYTIKSEVSVLSAARLTALYVNGEPYADFKPTKTYYVIPVDDKPTLSFGLADNCTLATVDTANFKTATVEVTDGTDYTTYKFTFFYQNDIIPNADFSQWEGAKYNGSKPVGWDTPGNAANCYSWGAQGNVCTGSEVVASDQGGDLKLVTSRSMRTNSIWGSIPGFTTTGKITMNLTSGGNSSSSVSGNIQFRNTPQQLAVEYDPISSGNMNRWQMTIQMFDGSTKAEARYDGALSPTNTWASAEQPISYPTSGNVTAMNIILNSGHSENASAYGGNTMRTSTVHFRNLHFIYNCRLNKITVDGTDIPGFHSLVYDSYITLDAEYQGTPKITMVGQFEDQDRTVTWSDWYNNQRTADITILAEDRQNTNHYYVHFTRPQSQVDTLKSISLDGTPLANFNPLTTTYNVTLPTGTTKLPDINIQKASSYSTVTLLRTDSSYIITVQAEDSTKSARTYTINFSIADYDNSTLNSLTVAGHSEVIYNPSTLTYSYSIDTYDAYPVLTFERKTSEQRVLCTDSAITVTAGDGVHTTTYRLNVTRNAVASTRTLTSISIDGEAIPGFNPSTHTYTYDLTGRETYSYSFSGYNEGDTIVGSSCAASLNLSVSETNYVVNFTRDLSSDDALMHLYQDNHSVAGFSDVIYNYNISLNHGEYPTFSTRASDPDATLSLAAVGNGYDVTATAPDGTTTHTTTLRMNQVKDSTTTLANILINGSPLVRSTTYYTSNSPFRAAVTDYDITLLSADPKLQQPALPTVSAVASTEGQDISINVQTEHAPSLQSLVTITVRSEAGNETEYILTFSIDQSDNTYLNDLAVNLQTLSGFAPTTTSYTHSITAGEQPSITYTPGDAYQTVVVNSYSTHAEVVVTSESGNQRTYSISFVQSTSSNANIENILIDGDSIPGFNPLVSDYTVQLPIGTTVAPTVTVVAGDDSQTINVNEGGIDAPTNIVVTAGDGSTTRFYTVTFDVQKSAVDTLQMIYIDGVPVASYSGYDQNYSFNLPIGVQTLPLITYDLGDEYQSAAMYSDNQNLIASILVTAQNGDTRNYILSFNRQASHNAELDMIYVDGDSLAGFESDSFNYVVNLPVGTTRIPVVTWIEGDQYQVITHNPVTSTDGMADIQVIAGDSTTLRTYVITFHRTLSSNSLLNGISINGTPITSFDPLTFNYSDTLRAVPLIEFIPGDQYQTFDTVYAQLGGKYVIQVHAEDNSTSLYTVNLVPLLSSNALLADMSVAGSPLANFDPETFSYVVTLPYGETTLPSVGYTPAEPLLQIVSARFAATISDTTYITVLAEDGVTENTYVVTYTNALSDNANLMTVSINGENLDYYATGFSTDSVFDPDLFLYNIVLPYGTNTIPNVVCVTEVPDIHSLVLDTIDTALRFAPIIRATVTSQDQRVINEYDFHFSVAPSTYALLADLSQRDSMLVNFNPLTFDYEITYPRGTDTLSLPGIADISFVKGDSTQTVTLAKVSPTEITATVLAEDGVTSNVYLIKYRIYQSDNALLDDIIIAGTSVQNFFPQRFDYTYLLNVGDTVPSLIPIPSDSLTQKVEVTFGNVGDTTYIYVTAENGSEQIYTVLFRNSDVNTAQEPWCDEVSFVPLGDGYYRASSMRKGVTLTICTMTGSLLQMVNVDLIDPNYDIHDEHHSGGTIIHVDKANQYFIYTFWYNGRVIKAGKFLR